MEYSSDQNIGQIISSLSHELRTPLTILSSNLQLLKSSNQNLDPILRAETFQLCEEALTAVSRFLDDIHFINLSNKNELKQTPQDVDINQLIAKVLESKNTCFYNSNRIHVFSPSEALVFKTDETLLTKVITNLLSNAYKFSAKEIALRVSNGANQLNIEIQDQGVGIPADQIEFIFMPFYRCENVKMLSGTGLGLSVAQKAANCLNGEIIIDSTLSKGTTAKLKILSDER
ncbi:HAMP domain-containing sensor histidine kinase [uncultured Sunxiuqinia sp.]|uniref:sensor histidine kinase n=1 Tax=uncultured Sunxiuqinia sp. TaxID=1573825 RepID=UPI002635910E|nr:HAMP domain-containing sensor histidine kinase [uncultured Sunxiuqinia sp.]